MAVTLPALTPMEDSLFLTLCARALDNRSQHPILADVTADEIVRTLDYGYGRFNINTNLMINVALRAKKLDEVASEFVARHPDAIGIDLGAGLDTRMIRIAPPSTVDWYDGLLVPPRRVRRLIFYDDASINPDLTDVAAGPAG
jgi:O-methyltransferase involved in polyketide biosynthesis